jgi:hypothetical protein
MGTIMRYFLIQYNSGAFKSLIWIVCILLFFKAKVIALAMPDAAFQAKLNTPIPEWMQKQIEKTVLQFDHQLSQKYLNSIIDKREFGRLVRVKIINGGLFFEAPPEVENLDVAKDWKRIFQSLYDTGRLPTHLNMDFIVSCEDAYGGPCDEMGFSNDVYIRRPNSNGSHRHEPLFVQVDCRHYPHIILPSWTMFESRNQQLILSGSGIPWEQRKPMVFFRGAD